MNKKNLYWICQIGGWLFFVLLNSLFLQLNNAFNTKIAIGHFSMFVLGVTISHAYRTLIVKAGWLKLKILPLIPRVIVATIVFATIIEYLQFIVESQLGIQGDKHQNTINTIINILNFSFVLFFWSLIYFLVHYIENYKKAEIENLKWSASIHEIELNKLKSQLNPHFMFNAMNSIRALVDENPTKSKEAITQLSNILRNTLQMGKNKVISFDEELKVINDYLALETIRYEERLKVSMNIHPDSKSFQVPPLMVQTLVENAIKHGISKLTKGGLIAITTTIQNENLIIQIKNSGQLATQSESDSGFGIKNTLQRLQLLYGKDASLSIKNFDSEFVVTELIIPKNVITYESDNH
ncbi:MAG: histidine kinase [Bacteroidetes bacterium]|nr:histidine kinase [Bacteroidota bacterium]